MIFSLYPCNEACNVAHGRATGVFLFQSLAGSDSEQNRCLIFTPLHFQDLLKIRLFSVHFGLPDSRPEIIRPALQEILQLITPDPDPPPEKVWSQLLDHDIEELQNDNAVPPRNGLSLFPAGNHTSE